MTGVSPSAPGVTYVVRRFPVLSQTFVVNEIADHLDAGMDVQVLALTARDAADFPVERLGPRFAGRVRYLDMLGPRRTVVRRLLGLLRRDARRTLAALATPFLRRQAIYSPEALRRALLRVILHRALRTRRVIHCHFGDTGNLVAGALAGGKAPVPLVTTIHAFEINQGVTGGLQSHMGHLFAADGLILTVNNLWRERILALGHDPAKVRVHHVGVDLEALQPEPGDDAASPGPLRICITGRMVEKKGHRFAVEAVAGLAMRRPDLAIRLDMIGTGPLRQAIEVQIAQLGVGDIVRVHGALSHEETLDHVRRCDVFLLPSVTASDGDMEGIPVALMEAMALCKPVVSTRHSGIPELVDDQVDGLLCPERDADALAAALERLADDRPCRERLGRAAREKVAASFNLRTLGRELRELYRQRVRES